MNKTSSARATKSRKRKRVVSKTGRPDHVVAAARGAIRKALKAHKAAGVPIVVWRDGKIVRIAPADI